MWSPSLENIQNAKIDVDLKLFKYSVDLGYWVRCLKKYFAQINDYGSDVARCRSGQKRRDAASQVTQALTSEPLERGEQTSWIMENEHSKLKLAERSDGTSLGRDVTLN